MVNAPAKRALDSKGVTMMELIVAMLVFSVIMAATSAVFAPILRSFIRANNLAEANTMLDNLSAIILADINNASGVTLPAIGIDPPGGDTANGDTLTINAGFVIEYDVNGGGHVIRNTPFGSGPVLDPRYYRDAWVSFSWEWDPEDPNGLVALTFTVSHPDGWTHTRTYAARPMGLMP
jgi:prepilin-type N-terminal cleavage/methylation domain-containing protein